jgi:hypothetical protein
MAHRVGTDPHVRPRRWDPEILYPLYDFGLVDAFAGLIVEVDEPAPLSPAGDAGTGAIDPS